MLALAALFVGCGTSATPASPPAATIAATGARATEPSAHATPQVAASGTAPPESAAPSHGADRWVEAGTLPDARMITQLALLGNGEVLIAGNDSACGLESDATDLVQLWNPDRSVWRVTDNLPSPRTEMVMFGLSDGRAMVTGGANQEYVAKSSTAVFNPTDHRWTPSGLLNTARTGFARAALPDGRVLVAGGLLEDRALKSAEIWDPRTGHWSTIAPMSASRAFPAFARLVDGRVLVVGGMPRWGANVPLASAEVFDPATGRWASAGNLNAPAEGMSVSALPDGGALVVGGAARDASGELKSAASQRFDPATARWSALGSGGPDGQDAIELSDGRVLVLGRTTSAAIYDPISGETHPTTPIPTPRNDEAIVRLPDGSVLIAGGWSEAGPSEATPSCPAYDAETWRFIPG